MKRYFLACSAIFLVAAPVVLFAAFQSPGAGLPGALTFSGRLIGFIAPAVIIFQMGLGSRSKALERGIGLDVLISAHRRAGVVILIFLCLHPLLLIAAEIISGYIEPLGKAKATGLAAISLTTLSLTAPLIIRRVSSKYYTWVLLHRAAYLVLPLVFLHGFVIKSVPSSSPFYIYWSSLAFCYLVLVFHRIKRAIPSRHSIFSVVNVKVESPGINTIHLEGGNLSHMPGQFVFLALQEGKRFGEAHPFTIASAPGHGPVSITIKAVGDFTGSISNKMCGRKAVLEGPYGNFLLPSDRSIPLAFLAGGIGITPFLSMLRTVRKKKETRKITLIWVNKHLADAFCMKELEEIEAAIKDIKIVYIFSQEPEWKGERGRLNEEILKRHVSEYLKVSYFLCGPPGFLTTATKILLGMEVPRTSVRWERFSLI